MKQEPIDPIKTDHMRHAVSFMAGDSADTWVIVCSCGWRSGEQRGNGSNAAASFNNHAKPHYEKNAEEGAK